MNNARNFHLTITHFGTVEVVLQNGHRYDMIKSTENIKLDISSIRVMTALSSSNKSHSTENNREAFTTITNIVTTATHKNDQLQFCSLHKKQLDIVDIIDTQVIFTIGTESSQTDYLEIFENSAIFHVHIKKSSFDKFLQEIEKGLSSAQVTIAIDKYANSSEGSFIIGKSNTEPESDTPDNIELTCSCIEISYTSRVYKMGACND